MEIGNEARNIPSSSCHGMVQEIHVLLVDHDAESLMNTTKMLEMCSYGVTVVGLASGAISTLSIGKAKFDIVMADVNSPDLRAFELLYLAVNMDLPVIFMSADDDTYLAMRALENGAFLFIKKPATLEILHCLWQHVYRKERNEDNEERFQEIIAKKGSRRSSKVDEKNPDYILGGEGLAKEKFKGGEDQWYHRDNRNLVIDDNRNKGVKRKVCTDWTEELHAKFMDAVTQLGEGRCFPKEILELMDIPGLTRMQVASHLQKCRNNNWQTPEERRSTHMFRDLNSSQYKPRKFGSMPRLDRAHASLQSAQISRMQPGNYDIQNNFGNVGYVPSTMTHASNTIQAYVQFVPGTSNIHSSDDLFPFQDPVCPIRNFSVTVPQGSSAPKQTSSTVPSPSLRDQAYPVQTSAVASVDSSSKGQWSSGTSNVESDGSETEAYKE